MGHEDKVIPTVVSEKLRGEEDEVSVCLHSEADRQIGIMGC